MCGLLGVINGTKSAIRDLQNYMEQGCVTGVLRGADSTGLFQVNRKGAYDICKLPYKGDLFVENKRTRPYFIRSDEPGATILHHRAATRGTISQANAHPFEHYDSKRAVVGVHNGTLNNYYSSKDGKSFDVDSDYLMHRVWAEGAEKTFGDTQGSFACIWYENDNIIRLITNGERSLYYAYVKDKNAMLIASEHGHLWMLAERNGIALERIVCPVKDTIHSFDINGDLRAPELTLVERVVKTYSYNSSNFQNTGRVMPYQPVDTTLGASTGPSKPTSDKIGTLESFGVTKGQKVSFWIDGAPALESKTITGWIEAGNNFAPAIMHNPTIVVIEQLAQGDYAEVECLGVASVKGKKLFLEEDDAVVVSKPLACISKSSKEGPIKGTELVVATVEEVKAESKESADDVIASIVSMDDLPLVPIDPEDVVVETVPGPNGRLLPLKKFFNKTKDGCISCGSVMTPKMARDNKITWVNNDQDPLCEKCNKQELRAG